MRVKTRKILSIILSMTILLGILPTAVFADYDLSDAAVIVGGTTEDTMPTLSAVYMTKDEGSGQFSEDTVPTSDLPEVFYIGLKISNFDKYVHMTSGLKSMTVSLVYDSKYVGPYGWKDGAYVFPGAAAYDGTITDDTKTVTNNYLTLNKVTGSGKNQQTKYLYSFASNDMEATDTTITNGSNTDTLRALQISITADTQTFTDLSTYALNDEYIAIVRFERQTEEEEDEDGNYPLVECPGGTKVIGHLQEGSTTMMFGDNNALTMNDGTTYLEKYLKLDASKAELFPNLSPQTGIKVTADSTALTYKDMQDVHGITSVIKVLESGDGDAITSYTYYYGDSNGKVGQSVDKSLTGLTEIKTAETNTWNNGVPLAANGKSLYIVAGDYMWNVGALSVSAASITKLTNATLTTDWTSGKNVIDVDNIKFKGGSVTAAYDNSKSKLIQYSDFNTNGLGIYRKNTSYTDLTGNDVKFAASNQVVVAVTSSLTGTVIESNVLPYSGKAAGADTYTVNGNLTLANASQNTYPDAKLSLSGLSIAVTNSDTGKNDTLAITDSSVTFTVPGVTGAKTAAEVEALTLVPGTMSGKNITVNINGVAAANLKTNTKPIPTVNKKSVNVTASATGLTKVYDKADTVSGAITYGASDLATGDSVGTISGLTAKYASVNVADGIAINITGTPASNNADFNNKYTFSTTMPTGVTGNITKKALTGLTFTSVTASQNPNQSGAYSVPDTDLTVTAAMGKVGSDDVKITMKGATISEADIKAGGSGKAVTGGTFELAGTAAGNYSMSATPTVTATVSNLPTANAIASTPADKAKIENATIKANAQNNTEAYLITGLANLPTEVQSNIAGEDGKLTITWTVDKAYTATGETYTYTGTVAPKDATKIVSTVAQQTVTVTVTPVTVTKAEANVRTSYQVGDTADALPATTELTDSEGGKHTVNLTWSPATVDTSADNTATSGTKYTATVDTTGLPAWLTVDNAAKTIEKTITVTAQAIPKAVSVVADDADNIKAFNIMNYGLTFKATDTANADLDALKAELPPTLKVLDENGTEHTLDIVWNTTDTYTAPEGTYTFTPTLQVQASDSLDISAFTPAEVKNVEIKVEKVVVKPDASVFNPQTIYTGATFTFTQNGSVTVDGITVPYTVAWNPAANTIDTSAVATIPVTITVTPDPTVIAANPQLTIDPADWTENVTMTVKKKVTGGGGGGTSSYSVKFSAGKYGTIIEGKTSLSVVSGKKVETTSLPTVVANEGYRFLGWSLDGKTVIDPTVDEVKKGVSYTALYEEIAKPTPTPTQTPLIKNNLKPYASGYDDGMFLPDDYITRAELASMIARLIAGDDIPNSYRTSFPDVDNTWYNKYIGYLEDKNVLSGYEDGTFRPNQTVTRGEMCAIIARAQRFGLIPIDGLFSDVTDSDWAKDYITTLAAKSIVSGYEDGTFGTYSPITRAETVVIINRVLEPSSPVVTFTPIDISTHWAREEIILAVNERTLINGTATTPEVTPEATPEVTPEVTPEETVEPTETPAA